MRRSRLKAPTIMHELSICQALVSQVLTLAQERAAALRAEVRQPTGGDMQRP